MANVFTPIAQVTGWASIFTDPDDLRCRLGMWVWLRWLFLIAWLVQHGYRSDPDSPVFVFDLAVAAVAMFLTGCVHVSIRSGRTPKWRWVVAVLAVDIAAITGCIVITEGFDNHGFVWYYTAVAAFTVMFPSFQASFGWVTVVASVYSTVCLLPGSGIEFEFKDEKTLLIRILTMCGVVLVVNLIGRVERIRRVEAVGRARELQRERIQDAQRIHNTLAQSAYMIDLGVQSALDAADQSNHEQVTRLQATRSLSKSILWELRDQIDAGPIFHGRPLNRVLRSLATSFTSITSIPADVVQPGDEPPLPAITRRLLSSLAHNWAGDTRFPDDPQWNVFYATSRIGPCLGEHEGLVYPLSQLTAEKVDAWVTR